MFQPETQGDRANKASSKKSGRYLIFALQTEEYGLEISKVRKIDQYTEVTAIPRVPHYIKGVLNLSGEIVPVIDLPAKLQVAQFQEKLDNINLIIFSNLEPKEENPLRRPNLQDFIPTTTVDSGQTVSS